VITTAFYSAIHFADYVLFPGDYETLSGDIKHFETFDNFYFMCRGEYDDRHMFRYSLIEQTIPEIADDFKTLMDNCRTARYVEYNFPAKIGDLSIKCLNDIKEVCSD